MKIIPIVSNKIEIEFNDGIKIEIYEVSTGHTIVLPKDMQLKQDMLEGIYRIVRRDENAE